MRTSESEAEQASINPEVELTPDDVQDGDGVLDRVEENDSTLAGSHLSDCSADEEHGESKGMKRHLSSLEVTVRMQQ